MCGRYQLQLSLAEISREYFVEPAEMNWAPNRQFAPSQRILTIVLENGFRHFRLQPWGLHFKWKNIDRKLINIRVESLTRNPYFRRLRGGFGRCAVPADGFIEWSSNIPHLIIHDRAPVVLRSEEVEDWLAHGSLPASTNLDSAVVSLQ